MRGGPALGGPPTIALDGGQPTGPFLLQETITPGSTSQPWAADPGAASLGVCVWRSVWPRVESKSFRPLNAQIEACPFVTAAVEFDELPIPPGTGGPWYGGPLISPAKALVAPTLSTLAAHAVTASKRNLLTISPLSRDCDARSDAPANLE